MPEVKGYCYDCGGYHNPPAKNQDKVYQTMSEFKHGKLHSGSKHGPRVRSRKQAVAIALSQARKEG